jgi:thiol-disulfide isomerase/thioredoxin
LCFKDIRYLPRALKDLGEHKAYVLVFTNTTCPVAQRYWPKLKQLDEQYRPQGVQFAAVNAAFDDSIPQIAQQAIDYGVDFPFVKDVDGSCAKSLGVQRTPEAVVLDASRKLRYRGRIDDQQRVGGASPQVHSDDLEEALDAVLAGRDPTVAETVVDGCLITFPTVAAPKEPVTFSKDIAPLLQKHCQECHHTGSPSAPFALVNFEDAANHAEMIAEVVADQRMPPWYGGRRHRFSNERGLSPAERRQIVAWVRGGRLEGDPGAAPPPREFHESKWEIGEPDLVTTALETHSLPADGVIDYKYVVLPYVFTQDTWISAAEILPGNPRIVHHCNMGHFTIGKDFSEGNFITGRVPGGTPLVADEGTALRIPKNSVVGLQIHYTTTGKREKNRMSVGFKFPRGIVHKELKHLQVTTSKIAIPPGASAHPVVASRTLPADASGIGMFSHMHLRGKDMTFIAHSPTGEQETLLSIPNYSYAWQQNYRWAPGAKKFLKGTRIEVVAHYDNSAFNPWNPDPKAEVQSGPQTFHEMMFGFFFYTEDGEELNLQVDPKTGRLIKDPPSSDAGVTR